MYDSDVMKGECKMDSAHLPAPPPLRQMLQYRARLVRLDSLGHHIQDIVHHSGTELQIKVRLHTLFGHRLGDTFRMTTFELSREEIAQPTLEQRDNTAEEKQPHAPPWSPEPDTRSFTHGTRIETVVYQMFDIFAHSHLTHQSILVSVHASQLTHMCEGVLQSIRKLERIDVTQAILHKRIHHQLRQAQYLSCEMKRISKTTLFSLLCSQRLHWLQVEVVVKMQVVEILSMDK